MANVDAEFALIARETSPGHPVLLRGKITAVPVTGDVWRWFTIPRDSVLVDMWISNNTDGGTDIPGDITDGTVTYFTDVDFEDARTARVNVTAGYGTTYTADTLIYTTIGTVNSGVSMTAEICALVDRL